MLINYTDISTVGDLIEYLSGLNPSMPVRGTVNDSDAEEYGDVTVSVEEENLLVTVL